MQGQSRPTGRAWAPGKEDGGGAWEREHPQETCCWEALPLSSELEKALVAAPRTDPSSPCISSPESPCGVSSPVKAEPHQLVTGAQSDTRAVSILCVTSGFALKNFFHFSLRASY